MRLMVLLLAGLALTLSACGGEKSSSSTSQDEARDAGLKFARCMREHGVDMPDPKVGGDGGGIAATLDPEQMNAPAFKRAEKACGSPIGRTGASG